MEYLYKYEGLEERQVKVIEAEGRGYRMLHDNFDDPEWKRGDPIVGTMTFTDEPEPKSEPPRDLVQEQIDTLEARIAQLEGSK